MVVVPETSHGALGDGRATVACGKEVIEEGELVWREHIAIWLGLDAIPQFGNGSLQDGGRLGIHGAIFAFASVF